MIESTALDIGPLQPFHDTGVVGIPDVHVAAALMRIGGHDLAEDPSLTLAAALCVRALRAGSVCVDLTADQRVWLPDGEPVDLPWPDPGTWADAVRSHPLVADGPDGGDDRPLRLDGTLLYLQRYWRDEQSIRASLAQRSRLIPVEPTTLSEGIMRLFPAVAPDRQRLAAATAALRHLAIIAGGPGTGKTTTVARILALLHEIEAESPSIALAAPTGKAAARLQEAVATSVAHMSADDQRRMGSPTASTLHRLLGWRPGSQGRFRHDRSNPLPHDVVIVDETSMVSLPMMARLVEAVRADARLVLVGDPDQLASIDAGAVLADLVAAGSADAHEDIAAALEAACPADSDGIDRAAATGVVVLDRIYRFEGGIAELAAAIRGGDADQVMDVLEAGHPDVEFLPPGDLAAVRGDIMTQASAVVDAATAGDGEAAVSHLDDHRVLCAHREGPFGATHWDDLIAGWTQHLEHRSSAGGPWYPGRALLVTANDYTTGLYNGDTGVVIDSDDGLRAVFARGTGLVALALAGLDSVQTLRSLTIHRGQGSQFTAVTVVLPDADSPLLTRELLYTAVTRARQKIRILGTSEAVRAGVEREVRRASGLRTI